MLLSVAVQADITDDMPVIERSPTGPRFGADVAKPIN